MKKSSNHYVLSIKYLQLCRIFILPAFCALVISTNAQNTAPVASKKALDKRNELQVVLPIGSDKNILSEFRNGKIKPQPKMTTQANEPAFKKPVYARPGVVAKAEKQTTYKFTGKGSWFIATNWENGQVPPAQLNAGDHVVIDGIGPCMFSNAKLFTLTEGSSLEVKQGKELYVSIGNNLLLQGGTMTNDGKLIVLSGVFSQRLSSPGSITNNGEFKTTGLSKVDGQIQNYIPPPKGHYKKADAKSGAAFLLDKDESN